MAHPLGVAILHALKQLPEVEASLFLRKTLGVSSVAQVLCKCCTCARLEQQLVYILLQLRSLVSNPFMCGDIAS